IIENRRAERSLDFLPIMGKQHLCSGDDSLKASESAVPFLYILAEFRDHRWVSINDRWLVTPNDFIGGFCHVLVHGEAGNAMIAADPAPDAASKRGLPR